MEKRKLKLNKQTLRNLSVLSDVRGGVDVVTFPPDNSAAPNCSHNSCTCKGCPNPEPPKDPKPGGLTGIDIPDLPPIDLTGFPGFGGRGF